MAEPKLVKTVDIRGEVCGMSVFKANSAMKTLEDGQVFAMLEAANLFDVA